MIGDLVMTQHHVCGKREAADPVSLGSYGIDAHEIRRIVKDGVVTREGKLVWEWWNPELVAGKKEGTTERRLIYRAARYREGEIRLPPGTEPPPARPGSPAPG